MVVANFALLLLLSQEPSAIARAHEAAEVHFKLGNEALIAGEAERAIVEYTSAHRLFPSAKILVNLGQAFERTGQPGRALWCYERFLVAHQDTDASTDPELAKGLATARRRGQVLRGHVVVEKPTEVNESPPADSVPGAQPPPPTLPAMPAPRPSAASLAPPPALVEVRPTPPSGRTKWIVAGAVVAAGAVATFFVVRALRNDCPYRVCTPRP